MNITDIEKELLEIAASQQTFDHSKPDSENTYNGLDTLRVCTIPPQTVYALIHDGNLGQYKKDGAMYISFFFDLKTLQAVLNADSTFDSHMISQYVQVGPWRESEDKPAKYRNSIAAFDLKVPLRLPIGLCTANTQFGGGQGHQLFIPEELAVKLQKSNFLTYNESKSFLHKGINDILSDEEYDRIQGYSDIRVDYCRSNNALHPDTSIISGEFSLNEPLEQEMFTSYEPGISTTLDYYSTPSKESIIKSNIEKVLNAYGDMFAYVEDYPDDLLTSDKKKTTIETNPSKKQVKSATDRQEKRKSLLGKLHAHKKDVIQNGAFSIPEKDRRLTKATEL